VNQPFSFRRDRVSGATGLGGAVLGPILVAVFVSAVGLFVYESFPSLQIIVLLFGINTVMVVGYQLFVGSTGIVSFGHIAFMAFGAYAGGISAMSVSEKALFLPELPGFLAHMELPIWAAMGFGGLVAALVALLVAVPLMRLSGAAASIATLGLLVISNNVLNQATPLTNAPQSIYGIPEETTLFWVVAAILVSVAISGLFKWSPAGLRGRAVRDDQMAAEASGVHMLRARVLPFVLSAFITGIGGALYALLLTAFSPEAFYVPQIIVILAMAIVGGINSISGGLIGALLITMLNEVMRRIENGSSLFGLHLTAPAGISAAVLGVALILTLRWRPEGLFGSSELQVGFDRRQKWDSWKGQPLVKKSESPSLESKN
jgi:branched-chain amino acid transport system permease protein